MDWRNSKGPDLEKNFLPGSFLLKKAKIGKKIHAAQELWPKRNPSA
jgi:hypothetical protein